MEGSVDVDSVDVVATGSWAGCVDVDSVGELEVSVLVEELSVAYAGVIRRSR